MFVPSWDEIGRHAPTNSIQPMRIYQFLHPFLIITKDTKCGVLAMCEFVVYALLETCAWRRATRSKRPLKCFKLCLKFQILWWVLYPFLSSIIYHYHCAFYFLYITIWFYQSFSVRTFSHFYFILWNENRLACAFKSDSISLPPHEQQVQEHLTMTEHVTSMNRLWWWRRMLAVVALTRRPMEFAHIPTHGFCYTGTYVSCTLQIIYGVLNYHPVEYGIYHMVIFVRKLRVGKLLSVNEFFKCRFTCTWATWRSSSWLASFSQSQLSHRLSNWRKRYLRLWGGPERNLMPLWRVAAKFQ